MHPAPVYSVTDVKIHYGYLIMCLEPFGLQQSAFIVLQTVPASSSVLSNVWFAVQIKGITLEARGS